jgi:hypothetical protein
MNQKASSAHIHNYAPHPNPEWAKTHVVCTICGFAAPFHAAAIGVKTGASCTVEAKVMLDPQPLPEGAVLLLTGVSRTGKREWLLRIRGAEVHVYETGDREIRFRASVPGYGGAGYTLADAVASYKGITREIVRTAIENPDWFSKSARAGRCYDHASLLIKSLVCPSPPWHVRGVRGADARMCRGGGDDLTFRSINSRAHCRGWLPARGVCYSNGV